MGVGRRLSVVLLVAGSVLVAAGVAGASTDPEVEREAQDSTSTTTDVRADDNRRRRHDDRWRHDDHEHRGAHDHLDHDRLDYDRLDHLDRAGGW